MSDNKVPMPKAAEQFARDALTRKLGYRIYNWSHAVYGPGYAASGMTWDEWHDQIGRANPDRHPFDKAE